MTLVTTYPSTGAIEAEIRVWWRRRHWPGDRWNRSYARAILRNEIVRLRYFRARAVAVSS